MNRLTPTPLTPAVLRALLLGGFITLVAGVAACGDGSTAPEEAVAADESSTTDAPTTTAPPSTTTEASPTTAPSTTTSSTGDTPSTTTPVAGLPSTDSEPLPKGATTVMVIGDSVLRGAREVLPAELEGWDVTVDAEGSRRLTQAMELLAAAADARVVVIGLGNNYIPDEASPGGATDYAGQIDEAMDLLADVDRVVWLTVAEVSDSRRAINDDIRAAADRYDNLVVADWAAVVAANPGEPEIAGDALHLGPAGKAAISALIAAAVGPAPG